MNSPEICLATLPIHAPGDRGRRSVGDHFQPRLAIVSLRDYLVKGSVNKEHIRFVDIESLDPPDERIFDIFANMAPDIVGLSAVLSHSYQQARRIAKIVRSACPDAWIILGGHLAASANVILRRTEVDCCVVGDGEMPLLEFFQYVERNGNRKVEDELSSIKGMCFLDSQSRLIVNQYAAKPLNEEISIPDYEFFKKGLLDRTELLSNYFVKAEDWSDFFFYDERSYEPHRKRNIAQVPTTKGCTARCTFCQRSTKGYRKVKLDILERHLIEIIDKYDVGFIEVLDENFGSRKDHTYAFADLMKKYDLLWVASGVRCTNVDEADIIYYKESGCSSLKFGIESGSQKILDSMEKNFTVDNVIQAVTLCWKHGLYSPLAFMLGMPGEKNETVLETAAFIAQLAHGLGISPRRMDVGFFYALPFAGTPLYEYAQSIRLIGESAEEEEKYLEWLASTSTNKFSHLNVNSEKFKNVMSWDFIAVQEANRIYKKLQKKERIETAPYAVKMASRFLPNKYSDNKKTTVRNIKSAIIRFEELVYNHLYTGSALDHLPRWLAYPIIRTLYQTQLTIHRIGGLLSGKAPEPFGMLAPKVEVHPYFDGSKVSKNEKRLERSLRHIVRSKLDTPEDSDDKSRRILMKGAAG